jgi:CHAD domain-containing protein
MAKPSQDTLWVQSAIALVERQIGRQIRTLSAQLDDLSDGQLGGDDVACVHRSRVASRRLRVALSMLDDMCGLKQIKTWKKRLQRAASELGEARDRDVQIETLTAVLAGPIDKSAVLGVSLILSEIYAQRLWVQRRVISEVRHFQKSGVLAEIPKVLKRASVVKTSGKKPVALTSALHFQKQIAKRIEKQYAGLEANSDALQQPRDYIRHHAMRISAKRLRYSLEIVKGMFRLDLEAPIAEAKKAQSLLGEVHDCDVWLERLNEWTDHDSLREKHGAGDTSLADIAKSRVGRENAWPAARLEVGVSHLRRQFTEKRDKAFTSFIELWNRWQADRFWQLLLENLRRKSSRGDPLSQKAQR